LLLDAEKKGEYMQAIESLGLTCFTVKPFPEFVPEHCFLIGQLIRGRRVIDIHGISALLLSEGVSPDDTDVCCVRWHASGSIARVFSRYQPSALPLAVVWAICTDESDQLDTVNHFLVADDLGRPAAISLVFNEEEQGWYVARSANHELCYAGDRLFFAKTQETS
jgi:hypothetical protein